MRVDELICQLQGILAEHGNIRVFNVEAMGRQVDQVYKCRVWLRTQKRWSGKEKVVYLPVTGEPEAF